MTEREFQQLRGYGTSNHRNNRYNYEEEPRDGYFAFFKLRCLICLVLFLGLVAVDRQLDIREYEKVQQAMQMLNKEEVTVEECFQIFE